MAFLVIPAVDIQHGRCVRLVQGALNQSTLFDDDPVHAALRWQYAGATWLHVVDLDGAVSGEPVNEEIIVRIVASCRMHVEVSGGVRNLAAIERLLALGVSRVVLGTIAVEAPEIVGTACARWGERIVLGVDAREGHVATRGWLQTTDLEAVTFAQRLVQMGVRRIIATDIERDGTLTSPNFAALEELIRAVPVPVIASGGVASAEHLGKLRAIGAEGAVVGRAFYDGSLTFAEALLAVEAIQPIAGNGGRMC